MELIGRDAELEATREWFAAFGRAPSALVIEGEAGIGKSTLWRRAIEVGRGMGVQVRETRAVESEAQPGLAALADLLADDGSRIAPGLPDPQRRALEALVAAEANVDLRPLGTAVHAVVTDLASRAPVVLAIDDAQWLDRASARTLEFALRRVTNQPVGVLATVRTGDNAPAPQLGLRDVWTGDSLTRITLRPLSLGALGRLIAARTGQALRRPVLTRLERVSNGNPLFALEIVSEILRAGSTISVDSVLPVPADMRRLAAGRLATLGPEARDVVDLLAVMARPELAVLGDALRALRAGATRDDINRWLVQAVAAGLLDAGGPVAFRHPLLAAAAYAAIEPTRRQTLHGILGRLAMDAEERARHLALATLVHDAEVAGTLTKSAETALARGAPDAAISLATHALRLTPPADQGRRHERALLLAQALWDVGDAGPSAALLDEAIAELGAGPGRATARLMRAVQLAWDGREHDAVEQCELAIRDAPDDPRLCATAHLRIAYTLEGEVPFALQHAEQATRILRARSSAGGDDLLACALLMREELRRAAGHRIESAVLAEAERLLRGTDAGPRPLAFDATGIARERLWLLTAAADDIAGARRQLEDLGRQAREAGLDRPMPVLLADLTELSLIAGDLEAARRDADEAMELAGQPGTSTEFGRVHAHLAAALVASHVGDLQEARALGATVIAASRPGDLPHLRLLAALARAELAAGSAHAAAVTLASVVDHLASAGVRDPAALRVAGDHVEALVLTGDREAARERADVLDRTPGSGPWLRAVALRSLALLAAADGHNERARLTAHAALASHESLGMPVELGRALLLAGRLERSRKAKRVASELLSRAAAVFASAGALGWRDRALAESTRLGLRPRAPDGLTATESEVAALAAQGLTNRQVAEALVMSPRSIDGVLGRVYQKLGIHSRAELGARLGHGVVDSSD